MPLPSTWVTVREVMAQYGTTLKSPPGVLPLQVECNECLKYVVLQQTSVRHYDHNRREIAGAETENDTSPAEAPNGTQARIAGNRVDHADTWKQLHPQTK
jgi:hypothetical protein